MSVGSLSHKLHSDPIRGLEKIKFRKPSYKVLGVLVKKRIYTILKYIVAQIVNPLILLLVVASILSFVMGNYTDAWLIIVAILLNVVVGFYQRYRADRAVEALKKVLPEHTYVIRKGVMKRVMASNLVLGDLVVLSTGAKIPADLRLVYTDNFTVDESILTGESEAVIKTAEAVKANTDTSIKNITYAGSIVLSGQARGMVIAKSTESRFVHLLYGSRDNEKKSVSALEKEMQRLTRYIALIAILVLPIGMVLMLVNKLGLLPALLYGISMFVAAVPEGLPIGVTIALALSAHRMAKKKVIVHNLPTADTLASIDMMLLDKTGTLTHGNHIVNQIWLGGQVVKVKHSQSKLRFFDNKSAVSDIDLAQFMKICRNSSTVREYSHLGGLRYMGDSIDVALYSLTKSFNVENLKKISEIKFESSKKFSASVVSDNKNQYLYVKGAPEVILRKVTSVLLGGKTRKITQKYIDDINMSWHQMARDGLKVIVIAYSPLRKKIKADGSNITDLTIVGIAGIRDELKADTRSVLDYINRHGIETRIVSGDTSENVVAVARAANIKHLNVIEGKKINGLLATKRYDILDKCQLFARMTPENKADILKFYQSRGHNVAFVGDGVNDALAIKLADVGIAVTSPHGDATADIADVVLTKGNLRVFVFAIREGRRVWHSLRSVVFYLLATNLSEILVILVAFAFSLPLPFTAVQILWINLLSDSVADEALIFGSVNSTNLRKTRLVTKKSLVYTFSVGAFNAFVVLALYFWALRYLSQDIARTVAFIALMSIQAFDLFTSRSLDSKSVFNLRQYSFSIFLGFVVILGLAVFSVVYVPVSNLLGLHSISTRLLSTTIILGLLSVAIFEILQLIYKKFTIAKE